jgi:hypothetical protein
MDPSSPESEENVISLQSISRTFMSTLQRQHDMLAFSLAGLRTSDPRAYDYYSAVSRVMPSPQNHLTADQVNAYARSLMMRTTINDLLGIAAECLHRCHLLCLLIKVRGQNRTPDEALDRQIGDQHHAFLEMNLQDKFEALESGFGIMCDLEDSIFSLAAALRVLSRVGGMVTNDDLAPDGRLTLEFMSMKDYEVDAESDEADAGDPPVTPPPGVTRHPLPGDDALLKKPTQTLSKLAETTRTFQPGEMLDLSEEELLGLNITVAKFFDGLFRSVDHYGRSRIGEGN